MSAIPIIAARPAPGPAGSATPPSPVDQRADGATFNAHLQDVQHRPSPLSSAGDSRSSSVSPPPGKAAGTGANGKADPAAGDTDADADSSSPTATQVLGLIQQSSGDAAAPASASGDGRPAGKTAAQGDEARPASLAVTAMPLPSPMPSPVSASQPAASSSGGGTAMSTVSLSTSAAAAAPMPGKANGAFPAADADATAAADDADDDEGDEGDNPTALASGTDAFAPASVDALVGNAHGALAGAAGAAAPAAGPAQGPGDLATLGGALAPPVVVASTNNGATPHSLTIAANVNSPDFSQELGQQVSWLGGQAIKQAQIRLNPQELGPLEVKVSVEHGRVDVVFAAQHPATVAAVQQSVQQLHQMLGEQGLSLGQATVGQHTAQQQFGHAHGQASSTSAPTADAEPSDGGASAPSAPLAIGLVDAFA